MTVSRRYIDSSSFKMALLFTVLLTISACMLGYSLIDLGKQDFLRETEAAIDIEISMLSNMPHNEVMNYIKKRTADDSMVRFRYEDSNRNYIGGTINPLPADIQKIAEGILRFDLEIASTKKTFAAKIHTFPDGTHIIVARNIHQLIVSYHHLKNLSWLVMILMLCVVLVSFGISYFVVSRINRIAAIAENIIQTGDLSQRLSIDSKWDDMSSLSEVLNGLLDKIEDLMTGIREVSNNIAHDLRTPLSGLRSDIEALKTQQHSVDDKKIDALLVDADRILAIFQALLRIANIEKGRRETAFDKVDLSRILEDVIDLYEPVSEEKNIKINKHIHTDLKIFGDSDLLFQLFANLLDNAIKFSPPASYIDLSTKKSKKNTIVTITDQGPGIADHEKDKVFRHFYRSDVSRHTPGNGLGLSLVNAIAAQHHAKIALNDTYPGLCVAISFDSYQ